MKEKVASCFVTFNPDLSVFSSALKAILPQVAFVMVFDNGSRNIKEIKNLCANETSVCVYSNQANLGISENLNEALDIADLMGFTWLLTLDQDSIACQGFVDDFFRALEEAHDSTIASVCPRIVYRNMDNDTTPEDEAVKPVPFCITSGNLIHVQKSLAAGGFDEHYFIDYVDFEFCDSLRKNGNQILQDGHVCLSHDLGGAQTVHFLGRPVQVFDKPLIRYYYMIRNKAYFNRTRSHGIQRFKYSFWSHVSDLLTYRSLPKDKKKKYKQIYRYALSDARHGLMGVCKRLL
jgi:rhamnosyltransferase